MDLGERLASIAGDVLAPMVVVAERLGRERPFHREGVVYRASVRPVDIEGPDTALTLRLDGRALVRFSRALPNLVGCAVRFTHDDESVEPAADDQDLLFATVKLPRVRLRTFHAGSRFDVDGVGVRRVRVVRAGRRVLWLESRRVERGARWMPVCELRLERRLQVDRDELHFWPFRAGRGVHPKGAIQAMRRPVYAATQDADGAPPHR